MDSRQQNTRIRLFQQCTTRMPAARHELKGQWSGFQSVFQIAWMPIIMSSINFAFQNIYKEHLLSHIKVFTLIDLITPSLPGTSRYAGFSRRDPVGARPVHFPQGSLCGDHSAAKGIPSGHSSLIGQLELLWAPNFFRNRIINYAFCEMDCKDRF